MKCAWEFIEIGSAPLVAVAVAVAAVVVAVVAVAVAVVAVVAVVVVAVVVVVVWSDRRVDWSKGGRPCVNHELDCVES